MDDKLSGRKRVATFSFKGVVAGRTVDEAMKARTAMENICKIVIHTYKSCMNQEISAEDKLNELHKITAVEPDLRVLYLFVDAETKACTVERVKMKMEDLFNEIDKDFHILMEEFCLIRNDPHLYYKVFDGIINMITNITEFFKEGVFVEQARMLDLAYDTVKVVRSARDATNVDSLVELGREATEKCLNLVKYVLDIGYIWNNNNLTFLLKYRCTKKLVSAQESNEMLSTRVDSAHLILMSALPSFMRKSKSKILDPRYVSF